MQQIVTRISNGERVDLSTLSVEDLYLLHCEEECFVASKVKKAQPFSEERRELLSEGYSLVRDVMQVRAAKESGSKRKSFGTSDRTIKILLKIIQKKAKQNKSVPLVFYEAGVGTGYAVAKLLENLKADEIYIHGCDIALDDALSELCDTHNNVKIQQGHVYDCILDLPDNSIDIFYADNVFEHFLPDEADIIYGEIAKKLKPNAFLFLLIPHKYTGPHDISKRVVARGEEARGFHFMEMSFNDITEQMKKHGIFHRYCIIRTPGKKHVLLIKSKILLYIKRKLEDVLYRVKPVIFNKKLKVRIANKAASIGYYSMSVMYKKS